LKLLLAGSRPEEIEALDADVARLQAQQNYLQEQSRFLTVLSPISGIMATRKLEEKVGEHLKKGDLIAGVHDLESVNVEIAVSENDIADVQIGQSVTLKARAHPHLTFQGQVAEIAPVARKENDWQPDRTVLVTTRLHNGAALLKAEMTGNAKISAGEHRLLELTTRRLLRYIRVEFWSWW
jgi:multidrug efflux pump subunit AcrA (membrane-fusion protein)